MPTDSKKLKTLIDDTEWDKFKSEMEDLIKKKQFTQGGPGSGNFGHAGIPGQRGGSASGVGGGSSTTIRDGVSKGFAEKYVDFKKSIETLINKKKDAETK